MTQAHGGAAPSMDERLREITERVAEMAQKAKDAGRRMNEIAVEATSRDRAVTVTVGSGGILKSVRPGPAASGMSATHICAAVMEAYGRASRQAAADASALMVDIVGKDTQAMAAMRAAMPAEDGAAPEDLR